MNTSRVILGVVAVVVIAALAYLGYQNFLAPVEPEVQATAEATPDLDEIPGAISAEGRVIPAGQVSLSTTQAGRVIEILARPGESVAAGDPVIRLDTGVLQASVDQAEAAVDTAEANLQAANTRLEQTRRLAHTEEQPARSSAWSDDLPVEIEQPSWFFDRSEEIASSQVALDAARAALETEQRNLQNTLQEAASSDVLAAEQRVANAQAAFLVARDVYDRSRSSPDADLRDEAQRTFEIARSELDAAQDNYDQILTTKAAEDIQEARARVAVARERYDTALDRIYELQTGEESLDVRAAQESVTQAEAVLAEAQAAAQAARLALEEATLVAPTGGTVVQLGVEVGEVAAPGAELALLADLSSWRVETTDLAETDVALVSPGMPAQISLDAFPDRVFEGVVREIDWVSEDSRGSVTYRVTLDFDPGGLPVRWGMTAFVDITPP